VLSLEGLTETLIFSPTNADTVRPTIETTPVEALYVPILSAKISESTLEITCN